MNSKSKTKMKVVGANRSKPNEVILKRMIHQMEMIRIAIFVTRIPLITTLKVKRTMSTMNLGGEIPETTKTIIIMVMAVKAEEVREVVVNTSPKATVPVDQALEIILNMVLADLDEVEVEDDAVVATRGGDLDAEIGTHPIITIMRLQAKVINPIITMKKSQAKVIVGQINRKKRIVLVIHLIFYQKFGF